MEGYCSLISFVTNKENIKLDHILMAYLIGGYPLFAILASLIGYNGDIYSIIYRISLCILLFLVYIKNKYTLNINIISFYLLLIFLYIINSNINLKPLLIYISSVLVPVLVLNFSLKSNTEDRFISLLMILLWPTIIGIIYLAFNSQSSIYSILNLRFELLKLNSITLSQSGCYFSILGMILVIKNSNVNNLKLIYYSIINFLGLLVIYLGGSRGSLILYFLILILCLIKNFKIQNSAYRIYIWLISPPIIFYSIIYLFDIGSHLNRRISSGIFNDPKRLELLSNSIEVSTGLAVQSGSFNQNHPHNIILQAFNYNIIIGLITCFLIILTAYKIKILYGKNNLTFAFLGICFIVESMIYGDIITTFGLFLISSLLMNKEGA